jgi:hypothetical protein
LKFDVILTNPPFQDSVNRNKTPHKLWIDFTKAVFDRLLLDGGLLCQVSPASFASPSNVILDVMREHQTLVLRLDTEAHFRDSNVGSSFSDYLIRKTPNNGTVTDVLNRRGHFPTRLDESVWYLPNDFCETSLEIHRKVIFSSTEKLPVEWDYVTCHNIRRHPHRVAEVTLSETKRDGFPFEVYHTNNASWWSSVAPPWINEPKVLWSRSGYMKPVPDEGRFCVTDMAYFVRVHDFHEAEILAHNLSLKLIYYISQTAKWSGYGNERVFAALPDLPRDRRLTDSELFEMFGLTGEEVDYVEASLAPKRRGRAPKA